MPPMSDTAYYLVCDEFVGGPYPTVDVAVRYRTLIEAYDRCPHEHQVRPMTHEEAGHLMEAMYQPDTEEEP